MMQGWEGIETMNAIIGRREFLAGAAAFGLMPSLVWARTTAKWPNVQTLLDRYVAEKVIAGSSTALSTGGGRISYSMSAGWRSAAASWSTRTLWRIYSMSSRLRLRRR